MQLKHFLCCAGVFLCGSIQVLLDMVRVTWTRRNFLGETTQPAQKLLCPLSHIVFLSHVWHNSKYIFRDLVPLRSGLH